MIELGISLVKWCLEYFISRAMIITGIGVFITEGFFGMKAEYGRYNLKNKGFIAPVAWFLQELPAFLVPLLFIIFGNVTLLNEDGSLKINIVLLIYFMIHYFHRSCIYPCRITSTRRVNYLENFLAFLFCTGNGGQIAYNLLFNDQESTRSIYDINFILGTLIFFSGFLLNIDSDNRLLRLKKEKDESNEYKIPKGGLFEYVSAANYFSECLEWTGYALAVWNLSSFAFALFTWANIGPRGYHHHL